MSNKQKVKIINSLFTNKIVNEDSDIIQKSLVIAHEHYASKGRYDDALVSFDKSIEIDTKDGLAWGINGMILEILESYEDELESYDN